MKIYKDSALSHIAFPLGGLGAGTICLEGAGSLGQFSIKNESHLSFSPNVFAALTIKNQEGNISRVIEGPVPLRKNYGSFDDNSCFDGMGNGNSGRNYGLPRFESNIFTSNFPFAKLSFTDPDIPLEVSLTGFSPFTPPNTDLSALPAAALRYSFKNSRSEKTEAGFYFNSMAFLSGKDEKASLARIKNGFVQNAKDSSFAITVRDDSARVDTDWFDGGWFDTLTMHWNDIKACNMPESHNEQSPGGSVAVEFSLLPGETKTIDVLLAWYSPVSNIREGGVDVPDSEKTTYTPWYSWKYRDVSAVMYEFYSKYEELYGASERFSAAFNDTTLPQEVIEAVEANLCILKSPTILREKSGDMWAWEGCFDKGGSCRGSCTHVWNYAQAICHLFPSFERTLRKTEFFVNQNAEGHQEFRAALPIGPVKNDFHAASDGQLGGIMKLYREWRISGDTEWIKSYWEKAVKSLEYCIKTWDPKEEGVLKEPHHNTYDIEFWGADGMCSSFYLGALYAISVMGEELGKNISRYKELYAKGKKYVEEKLFNGEYFIQRTEWETLNAKLDISKENSKCRELLQREGPKYQYGTGCISDGVMGAWLAKVCGLGDILDPGKVKSHLLSVYKYNFKENLRTHENPQRPGFALGKEGGLLLCSWPRGGKPSLPFVYSDEVWTGIEYQVASHLISFGYIKEGMDIVKALRARYDGIKRNPYDEYECGHWYARALASYALLYSFTGIRYDAVTKTLYHNAQTNGDFRSFICTNTGYGTVSRKGGIVSVNVIGGDIEILKIIEG